MFFSAIFVKCLWRPLLSSRNGGHELHLLFCEARTFSRAIRKHSSPFFSCFPINFLKVFFFAYFYIFFFLFTYSSLLCLALSCSDYSSILTERVEGWFFTLPILALKSYSFCNVWGHGKVGSSMTFIQSLRHVLQRQRLVCHSVSNM